jgi:putative two-component system response regulator
LIVDDTPENLQVLYRALENDYQIFAATNGKEALAIATSHSPDLILLDILMPGMDGFEVCRQLKEDDSLRNIPVIFITALGQMEDESHGLKLITSPNRLIPSLSD